MSDDEVIEEDGESFGLISDVAGSSAFFGDASTSSDLDGGGYANSAGIPQVVIQPPPSQQLLQQLHQPQLLQPQQSQLQQQGISHPQPVRRTVTAEEVRKWTALYPCYFDPRLTVAQGRRLPRERCGGCDDASVYDVAEACASLGLAAVGQLNKRHPRCDLRRPGRVLVELFPPPGAALAPARPQPGNKARLLEAVARAIPGLPNRAVRFAHFAQMRAEWEAQQRLRGGPKGGKAGARAARRAQAAAGGEGARVAGSGAAMD